MITLPEEYFCDDDICMYYYTKEIISIASCDETIDVEKNTYMYNYDIMLQRYNATILEDYIKAKHQKNILES